MITSVFDSDYCFFIEESVLIGLDELRFPRLFQEFFDKVTVVRMSFFAGHFKLLCLS